MCSREEAEMKKKEIIIVAVLALIALLALAVMHIMQNQAEGEMVAVVHRDQVVLRFDPQKNKTYHVDGNYGGLEIEVKDGSWHVINEQCPNHICAQMGWMTLEDIYPIQCIPNDVTIMPEAWLED